jgi:predicted TIM-barrel fold metal-dependent hydrolase
MQEMPPAIEEEKQMSRLGKLALEMAVVFCLVSTTAMAQQTKDVPSIMDVHLHALHAGSFGSPTPSVCTGDKDLAFAPIDPKNGYSLLSMEACSAPMQAPQSDEQLQRDTLDRLDKYNIAAVTSGSPELVSKWRAISPNRIIPGLAFNLDGAPSVETLRQLYKSGKFTVLGEALTQYEGISPDDPAWEPYFALCEELDIPVGIHTGLGPPGASYFSSPKYRARISNPLLLEDVLVRHPKLRLYVMHAGWPMSDQMVALLYAHPQVYVDVAVIDWAIPRKEFHQYLRRLVEAGFGKRIMFGSDQMVWPGAIDIAIEGIRSADFLSEEQKRDIFYNNAVRFLRWNASKQ